MHQNRPQAYIMAKFCSNLGYNIDVIDVFTSHITLTKTYDLLVDSHPKQNPYYQNHLKKDVKKVVYLTGANPKFSNREEAQRVLDINKHQQLR